MFNLRGIPACVRFDNGPEFAAEAVRGWITAAGARTAFIEPGSLWKNGYIESLSPRLWGELRWPRKIGQVANLTYSSCVAFGGHDGTA